jgi:hypothetical protein
MLEQGQQGQLLKQRLLGQRQASLQGQQGQLLEQRLLGQRQAYLFEGQQGQL